MARLHVEEAFMRPFRSHLTYANAAATVALVIAVGGGAAYAANTISSADIIDGQVRTNDISDVNGVRSIDVLDGTIRPQDLNAAAQGSRARGYMTNVLTRSKNVVAVTNPSDGIYCIEPAATINPATATVIPSTEFGSDSTSAGGNQVAHAEWYQAAVDCPGGTLEVRTWLDVTETQQQAVSNCAGCTVTDTFREFRLVNQGFSFMIP
jgi:hypothetical protein